MQNERNGFLFPIDNAKKMAKRMRNLIEDTGKRAKMGIVSQKIAIDNYTLDKMIQKYDELYKEQ